MRRSWTLGWGSLAGLLALAAGGCGNDPGPVPNPLQIQKSTKSGDNQTGLPGQPLDAPLRVVVTRDGAPVAQTTVAWRAANGGSFSAPSSPTDASGIASATWTLGPGVGGQTATASIPDAIGSPITFTATASDDGGGGPPPPEEVTVNVIGPPGANKFAPASVVVTAGATVTWIWGDVSLQHNVTPDDGVTPPGEEQLFDAPHQYSFTFTEPGTYHYYCFNHGGVGGQGMSGSVIVEAAQ